MILCCYDGISVQNRRKTNMDSLLLKHRVIGNRQMYLAVICDGVGSMQDGAFAASQTINLLSRWFDQLEDTHRLGLRLRDYIFEINNAILQTASEYGLNTATTLSALLLDEERYYVVHAGDSRIYAFQRGTCIQLTCDNVSEQGGLTECIGKSLGLRVFYNEGISRETRFLLCTDGLYKRMDLAYFQKEVERATPKTIKKTLERLANYVVERGEGDNISIALIIHKKAEVQEYEDTVTDCS